MAEGDRGDRAGGVAADAGQAFQRGAAGGQAATKARHHFPRGTVQVGGELWSAELVDPAQGPLPPFTAVEVVEIDGVRLKVRRAG
ncbi:hypothetical protein EG834_19330 [bacterium]|nr:hypothetical protein [bacterium]